MNYILDRKGYFPGTLKKKKGVFFVLFFLSLVVY